MKTVMTQETLSSDHDQFICWKSIFGGLLISIIGYLVLSTLGVGVGGAIASKLISNEENASGLAAGAGLWIGLSVVVSLFLGSYFTLRTSKFVTSRIGAAHGFIVSSLFFILMIALAGSALGTLSMGIGKMVNNLGRGVATVSTNPAIQDTIENALGNSNLKSDPQVVAEGLAVRLIQGDIDSARNYFAYETGLSPAEVDTKMAQLKTDFDQTVKVVGERAATVLSETGWTLFITFMVGLIAAMLGGRLGAQANGERPLYRDVKFNYNETASAGI